MFLPEGTRLKCRDDRPSNLTSKRLVAGETYTVDFTMMGRILLDDSVVPAVVVKEPQACTKGEGFGWALRRFEVIE